LAGYLIYKIASGNQFFNRPLFLSLCLFLAVAPDLDFIPGIIQGKPALYHQGISHSLIFALTSGFLISMVINLKKTKLIIPSGWILSFAYASHLLLDMFGPDKRPPYGIPLFWPISGETYQAPFQILLGVSHAHSTSVGTHEWIATILQPYNLLAIGIELVVIFSLIFLSHFLKSCYTKFEKRVAVKGGGN